MRVGNLLSYDLINKFYWYINSLDSSYIEKAKDEEVITMMLGEKLMSLPKGCIQ